MFLDMAMLVESQVSYVGANLINSSLQHVLILSEMKIVFRFIDF